MNLMINENNDILSQIVLGEEEKVFDFDNQTTQNNGHIYTLSGKVSVNIEEVLNTELKKGNYDGVETAIDRSIQKRKANIFEGTSDPAEIYEPNFVNHEEREKRYNALIIAGIQATNAYVKINQTAKESLKDLAEKVWNPIFGIYDARYAIKKKEIAKYLHSEVLPKTNYNQVVKNLVVDSAIIERNYDFMQEFTNEFPEMKNYILTGLEKDFAEQKLNGPISDIKKQEHQERIEFYKK